MSAVLDVTGLVASYGRAQVLFGVDLSLAAGEVRALMGRNGAGKSTTLKAIMGLVPAQAERLAFQARSIQGRAPFRIARAGLGYVPEDRRIFTDLSVAENLSVARGPERAAGGWTQERLFEIFPNLAERRDRRASAMSGGEQQMLTVARTLMGNPVALLLDEPSEGLAPVVVEQMGAAIARLKGEGLSILLSEQNLAFATAVSDSVSVIESGRIRYAGSMADFVANPAARDAFLGV